jgi:hypothetical protein
VLKGATGLLPEIDAVSVEASDVEIYEGQALLGEIERFLADAGFCVVGRFMSRFTKGSGCRRIGCFGARRPRTPRRCEQAEHSVQGLMPACRSNESRAAQFYLIN